MHCELRKRDQLILFPTTGRLEPSGDAWRLTIRGWMHRPAHGPGPRRTMLEFLRRSLALPAAGLDTPLFRERCLPFLGSSLPGRRLMVRVAGEVFDAGLSDRHGHVCATLRVPAAALPPAEALAWLTIEAVLPSTDPRRFTGAVQLVGPAGWSVVSDIDDTIKISAVHDRAALLANTFTRPFAAVDGMSALYGQFAQCGAAFHYVSASPWQLFGPLQRFLEDSGFPPGSFDLRLFRWNQAGRFESDRVSKTEAIEQLLQTFPDRRFILVGDSGQQDAEIYAHLASRHPRQVALVLIRDLDDAPPCGRCFDALFAGLDPACWRVLKDPCGLTLPAGTLAGNLQRAGGV